MVEIDEFLSDEAQQVAVNLKKTTANLVRAFYTNPDLFIKLRSMTDNRNSDFLQFLEAVNEMKKLWAIKLVTPMEEETSMKNMILELTARSSSLKKDCEDKRQNYTKFIEENQEQKDQRELEI